MAGVSRRFARVGKRPRGIPCFGGRFSKRFPVVRFTRMVADPDGAFGADTAGGCHSFDRYAAVRRFEKGEKINELSEESFFEEKILIYFPQIGILSVKLSFTGGML